MVETFLRTKLFIPTPRPSLVVRERLFAKLAQPNRVVVVAAPAGFGKTTLVTEWLQRQDVPAAWLSLDKNDDTPTRFFTYLIAALQTVEPEFAAALTQSLHATTPPKPHAIVTALLNALSAITAPRILVLDDFHVITDPEILTAVTTLIDYLPAQIQIVITSRTMPPLPLSRWRVRHWLVLLDSADLRFTPTEVAHFLQITMQLSVSEAVSETLAAQTEGWVAALQLAALSIDADGSTDALDSLSRSNQHIADYLLQEVLQRQPSHIQTFLRQTAILERFNADLCNAIMARDDSQTLLATLEQQQLFLIPLDNHRRWYRYHHLFAELLREDARRHNVTLAPLHQRALRWYDANGFSEEAISHAMGMPDYAAAVSLISKLPTRDVYGQIGVAVQRWVAQIPPAVLSKNPHVVALAAGSALLRGDLTTVDRALAQLQDEPTTQPYQDLYRSVLVRNRQQDFVQALTLAQRALADEHWHDQTLRQMAQLQLAINYLSMGQFETADEMLTTLWRTLAENETAMQIEVISMRFHNSYALGNLHHAEQLCRSGIALAGASPLVGLLHANLGQLYYEWDRLEESAENAARALDHAQRSGIADIFTHTMFLQLKLAAQRQDREKVEATLQGLRDWFMVDEIGRMDAQFAEIAAYYRLRCGDIAAAVAWADQCGAMLTDTPIYHQFETYHTLAIVRLAQNRQRKSQDTVPQLLTLINKLEQMVVATHHVTALVATLTLKAVALDYAGRGESAETTLQTALQLAKSSNMRRAFLDWGEPMRELLSRIDGDEWAASLCDSISEPMPSIIQLTPRESEILTLLAEGLSNKAIEIRLVLSKNTVRTHLKNLYSKLKVSSRTQALHRARAIGLLP